MVPQENSPRAKYGLAFAYRDFDIKDGIGTRRWMYIQVAVVECLRGDTAFEHYGPPPYYNYRGARRGQSRIADTLSKLFTNAGHDASCIIATHVNMLVSRDYILHSDIVSGDQELDDIKTVLSG
jgi:hypothetical protein